MAALPARRAPTLTTTGSWKHHPPPLYFLSALQNLVCVQKNLGLPLPLTPTLQAMSTWGPPELAEVAQQVADAGAPLLFDSGVFTLLAAGDELDPYTTKPDLGTKEARELLAKSDDVYGDPWWQKKAWGFIEFDLGPPEAKTRTRQRLEDRWGMGLIPVFHLVVNPWSYLHTLADEYDRICVTVPVRLWKTANKLKLMGEVCERLEGSGVWVHALAASPDPTYVRSLPVHSLDAVNWLSFSLDRAPLAGGLDPFPTNIPPLNGLQRPRIGKGKQLPPELKKEYIWCRQRYLGLLGEECRGQSLYHLWASRQQIGEPRPYWRNLLPSGSDETK